MGNDAGAESYGARRAVNELLAIFTGRWRNGILPQIRFVKGERGYRPDADDWGVTPEITGPTQMRTSGITQPPITGMCAYEVFWKLDEQARQRHYADFVAVAMGLEKYHDWLLRERDPLGEKLVVCLHPWETGTDNSPAFDPLIEETRAFVTESGLRVESYGRGDTRHVSAEQRPTDRDYYAYFGLLSLFRKLRYDQRAIIDETPFLLQDVLFNSLFVVSLAGLAKLEEELADATKNGDTPLLKERAARNRERAEQVSSAIRRKLWDGDTAFFCSYDLKGGTPLRTPTVSGFMPLMGSIARDEQANTLLSRLEDPAQFWTPVPVPSTSAADPAFNRSRYWSGPSWPVTNWLVLRGLYERRPSLGTELHRRTLHTIAEGHDLEEARQAAERVMEQNSFGEEFTTPSTRQYQHAWLWDSAIAAISWPFVRTKPDVAAANGGASPGFWEYYDPFTGAPLGAQRMTWTASLFLELYAQL